MRVLALDLGTKTLGLAISDKLGLIAQPYKLIRFKAYEEALDEVCKIINDEQVDKVVLGLPKNMNNSLGFASERSLNFKKMLEERTNKEIVLVDERLSTVEAENILINADVKRKKRKEKIDCMAACIILDTYLRSENNE